jgi:hypothetical protein
MPRCCAGTRCEIPELGLGSEIKNCRDCDEKIHDVCAFEDEEAGLSKTNVCPYCWDERKPPAEDDGRRGASERAEELEEELEEDPEADEEPVARTS